VHRLALLTSLYLAQGLPYGFFTQALPVVLRKEGMSLTLIGFSAVLALPWGLKFLWAPLIDRFTGSRLGPRRGWILPLQGATIATALALAVSRDLFDGTSLLLLMSGAVIVMNLLAATQDIATDALAVDVLDEKLRGLGNGIQVAAYRIGMVIGGGVLVAVFDQSGWRTTFAAMAAILAVASIPIALHREDARAPSQIARTTSEVALAFIRRPGVLAWLAVVFIYKMGDALLGPMARVMLVDAGTTMTEIGTIFGVWGSAFGLVGAMVGGYLAGKIGRLQALVVGGVLHTVLIAAWAWPSLVTPELAFTGAGGGLTWGGVDVITALVILEHFTGGIATVALFTSMMDVADPHTGGTDYTVQACVVVGAQFLGSFISGASAQALGYAAHFMVAAHVSALGIAVMVFAFPWRPARASSSP
jgi:MFS transporter, PAT family, beta-lactamase induction signal transducer AmpG